MNIVLSDLLEKLLAQDVVDVALVIALELEILELDADRAQVLAAA